MNFGYMGNAAGQISAREPLRIEYAPRRGLGKLTIVNFLLGLVTLTIYRFWAKTNVRRHIWSCVHINGEPLEYIRKGGELFMGALIVFGLFILPYIVLISALQIALGPEHPAIYIVQIAFVLIYFALWGAALYRARRYQLSRTLWRGIRGSLEGSSLKYSLIYFLSYFASALSLGWATPRMNFLLQKRMIGNMTFGSLPFSFGGCSRPLYPPYAICWALCLAVLVLCLFGVQAVSNGFSDFSFGELADVFREQSSDADDPKPDHVFMAIGGVIIALGFFGLVYPIIWAFYSAKELSTFAGFTSIDGARFRLNATAWSLIKLVAGNFSSGS
jgi:uncharacterized membrane protein YjgN (DUF898 family)